MSLTVTLILLFCVLNVNVNVYAKSLACSNTPTNCECNEFLDIAYSCKDDNNNEVDLYCVPSKEIKITCQQGESTLSKEWYSVLKGIDVSGDYERVTIRQCPIPEKRIKDILIQLSIGKVKWLSIDYTNEPENTYRATHFEGLDFVNYFDYRNNNVTSLPEDVFVGLPNLTHVFLNRNYLQRIPVTLFKPVPNITFLDLAENNLTRLEVDTFKYLPKLRTLNLNANKLTNLTREVFTSLPHLLGLDLSSNGITTLNVQLFQDLSKLRDLNLNFNNIIELPEGIFSHMKSLTKFRAIESYDRKRASMTPGLFSYLESLQQITIERNNLTRLPEDIFRGTIKLTNLALSSNRLVELPDSLFSTSTNLEKIDLSNNKLTALNETMFRGLGKLRELNLERNQLTFLHEELFKDLKTLQIVYLGNNRLSNLHDDLFKNLISLQVINLDNNQLDMRSSSSSEQSVLKDSVKLVEVHLRNNNVDRIFQDWQLMLTNLELLDLSHNKLERLQIYDFQFLQSNIRTFNVILDYNNISLVDLRHYEYMVENVTCDKTPCKYEKRDLRVSLSSNPVNCDCQNYDFVRLIQGKMNTAALNYIRVQNKEDLRCVQPDPLFGEALTDVELKNLSCPTECPEGCSCHKRAVDQVTVVTCVNVDKLPTWLPNATEIELHLPHNNLKNLREISPLMNLRVVKLSLSWNALTNIDDLNIPRSLKVLELDHNQIATLDKNIVDALNRTRVIVSFHNNPWKCECTEKHLLTFIKDRISESLVPQVNNIICETTGKTITDLSVTDLCSSNFYLYAICISLAAFGLIFGLLTILYLQYEHEVKVFMFAHKIGLWLITEKEVDRDKEYDAFISYAHQDEEFIVKHLIPGLESGPHPYKLCLHYRNWVVGDLIPEQIVRSVGSSRRTIIVLSRNYLESRWANLEFRTAYLQALKERHARVIVILLEDLDPKKKLDPELKAYITMNTYLKWGDNLFWEKLRYALPHPQQYRKLKSTKRRENIDGKTRKKLMDAFNLKDDKIEKLNADMFIC